MAADIAAAETRLWAAADQLWANTGLRPPDFSVPVLGLLFEEAHKLLLDKGSEVDELEPTDYRAEDVVHLLARSLLGCRRSWNRHSFDGRYGTRMSNADA